MLAQPDGMEDKKTDVFIGTMITSEQTIEKALSMSNVTIHVMVFTVAQRRESLVVDHDRLKSPTIWRELPQIF